MLDNEREVKVPNEVDVVQDILGLDQDEKEAKTFAESLSNDEGRSIALGVIRGWLIIKLRDYQQEGANLGFKLRHTIYAIAMR